MKVYIVEQGCYSDRYVSCVFSTREKAQAHIDLVGDGDLSEYVVDERADDVEMTRYEAEIDLITGEIYRQRSHRWHGNPNVRSEPPKINDFRNLSHARSSSPAFGRIMADIVSYVSADHAIKLAAECRQAYLRDNAAMQMVSK